MANPIRTLKILIVDGDAPARAAICALLARAGVFVQQAEDGETALHMVRSTPIDAILVDINAPKLDGLDLVRALRAESTPRLRALPVVLLAADSNLDLAGRVRSAGASELLQKPLSPEGLAALLRRLQRPRASGSSATWPVVRAPICEEVASAVSSGRPPLKRGA